MAALVPAMQLPRSRPGGTALRGRHMEHPERRRVGSGPQQLTWDAHLAPPVADPGQHAVL